MSITGPVHKPGHPQEREREERESRPIEERESRPIEERERGGHIMFFFSLYD